MVDIFLLLFCSTVKVILILSREGPRRREMEELLGQGKVPHEVELEKHPELSVKGYSCKGYCPSVNDSRFLII